MDELGKPFQQFWEWATTPVSIDQVTLFLSVYVFALIAIALALILLVMIFVGVRTPMQRGWRSKVVCFNMIVWRQIIVTLLGLDGIPQPWSLIFWIIAGGFMLDFVVNFHITWVRTSFDGKSPWIARSTISVFVFAFFLALRLAHIWN
jgi:hypothetical protein